MRALDLLDLLGKSPDGLALTQLSEQTRLNASTVHRLLATLAARDYVRKDSSNKRYLLGPQSLKLGQAALSQINIRREAMSPMRELAEKVDELVNLALLTGHEATYMAQVGTNRPVQMFTQIGARVPLHCTGVGKAMLAFLPESETQLILERMPLDAYTINTVTNILKLEQELALTREHGFAVDDEERELGVRCIAAPIFGADGRVLAAVSISGPPGRLTFERIESISQTLRRTADRISSRLGYQQAIDAH